MRLFKSFGAALVGLVLASAALPAAAKTWTHIRIATEGAFPPWNFVDQNGKLGGFEIDLSAELCRRMKVTCEVAAQDWDGIIPALQAGKFDAIMAAMSITPKREEVLAFSRPYSSEPASFAVAKDGPLAKLPDDGMLVNLTKDPAAAQKVIDAMKPALKGKTIGVQVSTIHENFLEKFFKDTIEIKEYKTTQQHDLDLLAGRIDGIFGTGGTTRATLEKPEFKDFTKAGPRFSGDVFGKGSGVGLRKGDPDLKTMFDGAITSMLDDGSLKALAIKWFKVDTTPKD